MKVPEAVREKLAAVRAVFVDRGYASQKLENLTGAEILAELQRDPRLRTIGGLQAVLDRANVESRRDVALSRALAETVLELANSLPVLDTTIVLRGRALRAKAFAAREQKAVPEARALLRQAQKLLATTPLGAVEREYSRLLEAYIANEMGEHVEALRLVQSAFETFTTLTHAKGKLQALLTEGNIHFERQDFEGAQTAYSKALPLAQSVRDEYSLAVTQANLGHCAACIGQVDVAAARFAEALPTFDLLGATGDRDRIMWEMARLAAKQERLPDAARQFTAVREEFLRRGMFMSAAFVSLDFAEFLVTRSRWNAAREWCRDLVDTFTAAGMPEPALRVVAFMKRCADSEQLDLQVLGRVRDDLREHLRAA